MPIPSATAFHQGFGGTAPYQYTSSQSQKLSQAAGVPGQLPRTGGGSGSGGAPVGPLGPLALLGALAIAAGRLLPRWLNR